MAKHASTTQRNHRATVKKAEQEVAKATENAAEFFKDYARERPEVVALWMFGIGFILGWKLKPW
jgi:hypothetical protein